MLIHESPTLRLTALSEGLRALDRSRSDWPGYFGS